MVTLLATKLCIKSKKNLLFCLFVCLFVCYIGCSFLFASVKTVDNNLVIFLTVLAEGLLFFSLLLLF